MTTGADAGLPTWIPMSSGGPAGFTDVRGEAQCPLNPNSHEVI